MKWNFEKQSRKQKISKAREKYEAIVGERVSDSQWWKIWREYLGNPPRSDQNSEEAVSQALTYGLLRRNFPGLPIRYAAVVLFEEFCWTFSDGATGREIIDLFQKWGKDAKGKPPSERTIRRWSGQVWGLGNTLKVDQHYTHDQILKLVGIFLASQFNVQVRLPAAKTIREVA